MIDLCTESDVIAIREMATAPKLTAQITQASRWVQSTMLQRDFQAVTGIVELTEHGGTLDYWVAQPPVRSLTSIEFRDATGSWETQTYVTGDEPITDYEMSSVQTTKDRTKGRITFRERTWPRGLGNARITYNGGLWTQASEVSQDLRYATALIVVYGLNHDVRGGVGIQARTMVGDNPEILTFADRAAQETVLEILDGWRANP